MTFPETGRALPCFRELSRIAPNIPDHERWRRKKVTTIAGEHSAVRVPAGRDPDADWALDDMLIRSLQKAEAKAAVDATDPAEAQQHAELRDYLRDILRRHRLATDPEYREEEEARWARLDADVDMDPNLRAIYEDATILDNTQLVEMFGVGKLQIWNLAAPEQKDRRPRPHPRMSPEPDVVLNVVGGRDGPGIQLGKAAEWWRQSNRGIWLAVEDQMIKNPERGRYGRPQRTVRRERPRGRQARKAAPETAE